MFYGPTPAPKTEDSEETRPLVGFAARYDSLLDIVACAWNVLGYRLPVADEFGLSELRYACSTLDDMENERERDARISRIKEAMEWKTV